MDFRWASQGLMIRRGCRMDVLEMVNGICDVISHFHLNLVVFSNFWICESI